MIKRLRWKFVCINMMIVTVMLLVIFGMVLHFTQESLENQSLSVMESVIELGRHQPGRPGEDTHKTQLPFFVVTVDPDGEMTASSGGYYDLSDEEAVLNIIQDAQKTGKETGILKAYNLRFQKQSTPLGQMLVFVDISSEIATMKGLVKSSVKICIVSFFLFFGISVLLARWAIQPVETAWNQQRQFVADASHELKTPLTVIMTNAELLQSGNYSEEERGRFTDSILTMSHQMRGLVESLLELARVDNGAVQMTFAELEFSRLVGDAMLPFEPLYFEQGLELSCDIEEGIKLKGSQSHLRQVIDILLDNAMKYSAPQGKVAVSLKKQGRNCLLSVSNPGEPISPEDLKNIFKRFYRVDKVRSMNHSYGLGLSIAEGIVAEHHGKIWAESANGVNCFFVLLPTVP